MKIILEKAKQLAPFVFSVEVNPNDLLNLGSPKCEMGVWSVILANQCQHRTAENELLIDTKSMNILNIGKGMNALILGTGDYHGDISVGSAIEAATALPGLGPGDADFLRQAEKLLKGDALKAARIVLEGVRSKNPGDLKRGQRKNYSNTPDNFWYVIIQPRKQNLSITVRATRSMIGATSLKLTQDRAPNYMRFYVSSAAEAEEAVRIIDRTERKI